LNVILGLLGNWKVQYAFKDCYVDCGMLNSLMPLCSLFFLFGVLE